MTTKRKFKKLILRNLSEREVEKLEIADDSGWYLEDENSEDTRWVGAYSTKAEAMEAKKGLERFYRNNNE